MAICLVCAVGCLSLRFRIFLLCVCFSWFVSKTQMMSLIFWQYQQYMYLAKSMTRGSLLGQIYETLVTLSFWSLWPSPWHVAHCLALSMTYGWLLPRHIFGQIYDTWLTVWPNLWHVTHCGLVVCLDTLMTIWSLWHFGLFGQYMKSDSMWPSLFWHGLGYLEVEFEYPNFWLG